MHFQHIDLDRLSTPCYLYDTRLLRRTLDEISRTRSQKQFVHYALKANTNPALLEIISKQGFGADCVSGGEVKRALEAGFRPSGIFFAGVGKADWEIELAIGAGIGCFNVESIPELEVISAIARQMGKEASIAFRVNPNVDAHTHKKITTGLSENKFGIAVEELPSAIALAKTLPHISYKGLHFHIGSQITDPAPFVQLALRINEIQANLADAHGLPQIIDVGGGLGVDYDMPDEAPIADFASYFQTFRQHLQLRPGQEMHCELGRSVVAQCGSLLTKVLYVKQSPNKQFVICDAGMTDLLRPALYGSYHKCQNLTADYEAASFGNAGMRPALRYDVVGPICESSDVFLTDYTMPETRRGDYLLLRSAGAYGETMASQYNSRPLPKTHLY
ncbi:MAG: diaminopimelate decarboxylase [Bacteroidaceae bacterium]|nr:diaminopimelate decarboxylase [Bacteroidaceae bacterium]